MNCLKDLLVAAVLALGIALVIAMVAKAEPGAVCRVYTMDTDGAQSTGTGFAFGKNEHGSHCVLTNHHVVIDSRDGNVWLRFNNDRTTYKGKIVKVVASRDRGDMVLIICNRTKGPLCRLLSRPILRNERLRWTGFVMANPNMSSVTGTVVGRVDPHSIELRSTRSSISGESGSPVYDNKGYVVGIIWGGGHPGGQVGEAYFSPFSDVAEYTRWVQPYCRPVRPAPPSQPADPIAGRDGNDGRDGRGIIKTEIVGGDLWVFYDDGTNQNVGRVATDFEITDELVDRIVAKLPPVILELYLEERAGADPVKVDTISAPLGQPLKLLNAIEGADE